MDAETHDAAEDGAVAINIPRKGLVVLAGPAGSGKSTWAAQHFSPEEIVSSDACRAQVGRGDDDWAASSRAFDLFYQLLDERLAQGELAVADSTALTRDARRRLLRLARRHELPATLVVLAASLETCLRQNARRARRVPQRVIVHHIRQLEQLLARLGEEPFDHIYVLTDQDLSSDRAAVRRVPLPVERPETGPFDIVGDVHGCFLELAELLERLGYRRRGAVLAHPEGRQAVFLGDLTDRGPNSVETVLLVEAMVRAGTALYVPGNHCRKLYRWLTGHQVMLQHGLERTVRELEALPGGERRAVGRGFRWLFEQAPPYMILDGGRLVVAHAGIKEDMIGRMSRRITNFCLYGDTTGERTPEGLPVRRDWARDYRGAALIVYGHTPVAEPVLRHNTINIDQGCVFGGRLTAFRYPEGEVVQVPARAVYDPRPAIRAAPADGAAGGAADAEAEGAAGGPADGASSWAGAPLPGIGSDLPTLPRTNSSNARPPTAKTK